MKRLPSAPGRNSLGLDKSQHSKDEPTAPWENNFREITQYHPKEPNIARFHLDICLLKKVAPKWHLGTTKTRGLPHFNVEPYPYARLPGDSREGEHFSGGKPNLRSISLAQCRVLSRLVSKRYMDGQLWFPVQNIPQTETNSGASHKRNRTAPKDPCQSVAPSLTVHVESLGLQDS